MSLIESHLRFGPINVIAVCDAGRVMVVGRRRTLLFFALQRNLFVLQHTGTSGVRCTGLVDENDAIVGKQAGKCVPLGLTCLQPTLFDVEKAHQ